MIIVPGAILLMLGVAGFCWFGLHLRATRQSDWPAALGLAVVVAFMGALAVGNVWGLRAWLMMFVLGPIVGVAVFLASKILAKNP